MSCVELRRTAGEEPAPVRQTDAGDERVLHRRLPIVCAACGHRITDDGERIEIDGRHDRHCVNPQGYEFHIGCFRRAPGCPVTGAPTLEFTWFPGFAWSYALCGGCGELLGWRYDGADASSFYGLILNRLRSDGDR
jgi:hypothetical protein